MAFPIPPKYAFCKIGGKKHTDIFANDENAVFCGFCGYKPRPGPADEVVAIEDSPARPELSARGRGGSPASQIMRDRPHPPASALPVSHVPITRDSTENSVTTSQGFASIARAANANLEGLRKPTGRRGGLQPLDNHYVAIAVLLISQIRTRFQDDLYVESISTVKDLGELSIKFAFADLIEWGKFNQVLTENLLKDRTISSIDPANNQR
jgi:hypothetical protein